MKKGQERIASIPVTDEFHVKKYIKKVIRHLEGEEKEKAEKQLIEWLKNGKISQIKKWGKEQKEGMEKIQQQNQFQKNLNYLQNNRKGIENRLKKEDGVIGSSTEGHVSHVLADRMSSRPMGWSKKGVDKMAQLRAYFYNGGSMLELVQNQKKAKEKEKKEEELILSAKQIISSERNPYGSIGKYIEQLHHSLSISAQKRFYFQEHIWGL